jgi:hypothetical protein
MIKPVQPIVPTDNNRKPMQHEQPKQSSSFAAILNREKQSLQ